MLGIDRLVEIEDCAAKPLRGGRVRIQALPQPLGLRRRAVIITLMSRRYCRMPSHRYRHVTNVDMTGGHLKPLFVTVTARLDVAREELRVSAKLFQRRLL